MNLMKRFGVGLLMAAIGASFVGVTGCDALGGSSKSKKSSADEDDDDDDKKKKKKKKKKDDDEEDEEASAKPTSSPAQSGMQVPGIPGLVVPAGGVHAHQSLTVGDKLLEFENFSYPLDKFPRDKLRADFKRDIAAAGWTVREDPPLGYLVNKDGKEVSVVFGEAGATDTKINVFPPKAASGPSTPPPSGGDVVFAGAYNSAWGVVNFTQSRSAPTVVTGKYPRGTLKCNATGEKLDCGWVESSSTGRAAFTRDASGNLKGTWGSGGSATSGGQWNLTLSKAGALSD